MFFRYAPHAAATLFLASSLAACGGEATASSSDDVTVRTTTAALSLVDDLHPQVTSFDPLRIFLPGPELKAKLEADLLVALQAAGIHEKEKRLTIHEVNVDIGNGEITVKAKGKGGVRSCAIGCTGWMDTTVRAEVTVGLSVQNWIVTADHRHTDVSASNDFADALIRTFRDRVYPPINDGIKKTLASADGRDLRTELSTAIGMPIPADAVANVRVSPEGLTFETYNYELSFSVAGPVPGLHCISVNESADPDAWGDNYLCTTTDIGLAWSSAGPIAGMACTRIEEPADPHTWDDNYVCAPQDIGLRWSYGGPLPGMRCTSWNESADPHAWADNYLCRP